MIVEVCVDSIVSVKEAEQGGAHRIELCGNLNIGGTTPSYTLMKQSRKEFKGCIHALIRPRAGDFCYDEYEMEEMIYSIEMAKELGLDGVVIGILSPDGTLDKDKMKILMSIARPMKVTCHRAFDMTRDLKQALRDCLELGIDYILTSGGENSVIDGLQNLCELVKDGNKKIQIMPGSGVTIDNLENIIRTTGVENIHLSAKHILPGPMKYKNSRVSMGIKGVINEYERTYTNKEIVKEVVRKVQFQNLKKY